MEVTLGTPLPACKLSARTSAAALTPSFSKIGHVIDLRGASRTRPRLMVGKPPILLPLPDLRGPERGHPALANCCRPSCWPEQQAMDATGLKALGWWARALYHLPPPEMWELF